MRKGTPAHVKEIANNLRKNQTRAEEILWQQVRKSQVKGMRFQRQYPIGRYIADFYCSKANLIVEVDGKIHDESEQKEYDKTREEEIRSRGIDILRIRNEDVLNNLEQVLKRINQYVISKPCK